MKPSRLIPAAFCWMCGVVLVVGCSSTNPPPDTGNNEPVKDIDKSKTDGSGVGKGEILEAPPPPPGANKK